SSKPTSLTSRVVAVLECRSDDVWRVIPGATIIGNPSATITHPAAIHEAGEFSLSWLRAGRTVPKHWQGAALIVAEHTVGNFSTHQALIVCRNPRIGLGYALRELFADLVARKRVIQGSGVRLHPTAVIGQRGNSLEWDDVRWFRIPAVAGVVIEDDVTIGAMVTIVRGVLADTIIGAGTDVCNHVNVGHGARIGRHCVLAPFAAIGGSAVLGERVKVWQHAAIKNGVKIGDRAVIGQSANVLCDV
ncbi:unnamed protein product, partial [marine sediment metagenome]